MRKRALVRTVTAQVAIGVRRACELLRLNRASWHDSHQGRDDTARRIRLRELAPARPRFGYLHLPVMLRREGWGGESEAGTPHLSGRRAHGTAHAPPKTGQSSVGHAPAPEPGE